MRKLVLAASVLLLAAAPKPVDVTSKAARVLDLAVPWTMPMPPGSVSTAALAPADAAAVLAAPALDMEAPGQLRWIDGRKDADEKKAMASESGVVTRNVAGLVVAPSAGTPLLFKDKKTPATKTADGDELTYAYQGRYGKGRLHRVTASFQHDSPGSYLVSPSSGRTMFVHEGSDHVVLAPEGARLVVFNEDNGPLTLVVTSLGETGPSVELLCRAKGEKAAVELKGWHGADALDLVLAPAGKATSEKVPLRVTEAASGWTLAAPDPARLAAADGFVCRATR
jgi:hypothetical protein